MDTVNKEIIEKKVYEENGHHEKKNYATKGEALGVGIPALVLGGLAALNIWGRGGGGLLGGIGGGGGSPENVNINTNTASPAASAGPTSFLAWEKGCEDALALTNTIWAQKVNTLNDLYAMRNVDVNEKFQLYKSQVDADFGLYKVSRDLYDNMNDKLNTAAFGLYRNQRDGFDALAARMCLLEKEVAIGAAIRPYQDKLIQCEIDRAFTAGINYTNQKTCRMIQGIVCLPNSPTVTGFPNSCGCNSNYETATTAG